jgi:hypothetical protein
MLRVRIGEKEPLRWALAWGGTGDLRNSSERATGDLKAAPNSPRRGHNRSKRKLCRGCSPRAIRLADKHGRHPPKSKQSGLERMHGDEEATSGILDLQVNWDLRGLPSPLDLYRD